MSSGTSKPTLYERLGGVYSIAAVVDDFIDRTRPEAEHKELFAIVESTKGDIVSTSSL
jgi:truncated hemoglobin YjbI